MELFLLFPDFQLKNFFYKMFQSFNNAIKTGFENRKWNYTNRKWNYQNRKWNYFSYFQPSDQKNSFTKCFSFVLRGLKLIFKTGNRIIQTGNGIISPISRPLIKKLLLQHLLYRVFQNQILDFQTVFFS